MRIDLRCPLSRRERVRVRVFRGLRCPLSHRERVRVRAFRGLGRAAGLAWLTLAIALFVGCGPSQPAAPSSQPAAPAGEAPTPPPQPLAVPPPAPPEPVRIKAEKGVGAKGRGYGQGVIATPAATLFAAKERIAFEIQIPHAMNLFKGMEGRMPNSNEEFMEKIIKENHIPLPVLPEGERYVYDPKTELLMVEKPAQ